MLKNFRFINGLFFRNAKFFSLLQAKPASFLYTNVVNNPRCPQQFQKNTSYAFIGGILTYLGLVEKTPEEKESELITTIKRGILLIQKKEFAKAEQMLHLALKIAQEQANFDGVTYIYDTLANLAFGVGDGRKAEKLFVTVIERLLSKNVEPNDNKIIHISLNLARIYEQRSDFEKAEEGYKFCLSNLEAKVTDAKDQSEDTLALWGMSLDFYARYLLTRGRPREAFECFKKAYDKCVDVNGNEHEQTVVLLNDLGTVANMLGDNDKAVNYFEEAVAIGSKLPDMEDLGHIYVNLGQIYLLKEMHSKSKDACETARILAKKKGNLEEESEAKACLELIDAVFLR